MTDTTDTIDEQIRDDIGQLNLVPGNHVLSKTTIPRSTFSTSSNEITFEVK